METGALEVIADDGAAWVTSQDKGTHQNNNGETVSRGDGVFVDAGTVAGYESSGDAPLGLLLVSVDGIRADQTTGAAGAATASPAEATAR